MKPVLRGIVVAVGWMAAAVAAVFVSWVAAAVAANLTGVGEVAPGVAARTVAAEIDDQAVERIDEGRFCGFPCLVNIVPAGPSYEGSALLLLTDSGVEQVAGALTAAGFEPGDANLDIPTHQRLNLEGVVDGVPTVWHARNIAGTHGVVAQIDDQGPFGATLHFDEAYPPAPVRWAAPVTGLTAATGFAWVGLWFRRRG